MQPAEKRNRARIVEAVVVVLLLATGLGVRGRVTRDWWYAGLDSYTYLALATELRHSGRYALGPAPAPLYWGRAPLYPLFLAAVIDGDAPRGWAREAAKAHEHRWRRIVRVQSVLEVIGTGLLTWWLARRLAGRIAAAAALALVMLWPSLVMFSAAVLTESPATLLTTSALGLLVAAPRRPRVLVPAAGWLLGLGQLLRPDGFLLAAAFVPAVLLLDVNWRERALAGVLAVGAFALGFGPWPVRNLVRFGQPHVIVERLGKDGLPVHDADGFHHWIATWAEDDIPLRRFEWCFYDPKCKEPPFVYPDAAFGSPDELALARRLLGDRARGASPEKLSRGFDELAELRRRHHGIHVSLRLPMIRAWNLWVSRQDELLGAVTWQPWPAATVWLRPKLEDMSLVLTIAWLAGGLLSVMVWPIGWLRSRWGFRSKEGLEAGMRSEAEVRSRGDFAMSRGALILLTAIAARTLALAWAYYPEPRYVLEVTPAAIALACALPVAAFRVWAALRPRRGGAEVSA